MEEGKHHCCRETHRRGWSFIRHILYKAGIHKYNCFQQQHCDELVGHMVLWLVGGVGASVTGAILLVVESSTLLGDIVGGVLTWRWGWLRIPVQVLAWSRR